MIDWKRTLFSRHEVPPEQMGPGVWEFMASIHLRATCHASRVELEYGAMDVEKEIRARLMRELRGMVYGDLREKVFQARGESLHCVRNADEYARVERAFQPLLDAFDETKEEPS